MTVQFFKCNFRCSFEFTSECIFKGALFKFLHAGFEKNYFELFELFWKEYNALSEKPTQGFYRLLIQ